MRPWPAIFLCLFWVALNAQVPPRVMDDLMLQATRVTTSTAWTPASLSLKAWWIPESGYSTNGAMVQLTDSSGNGYTLTNLNTSLYWPQLTNYTLNGHSQMIFDGTNQYLVCANFTNTQPFEVWIVSSVPQGSKTIYVNQNFIFDSFSGTYRIYSTVTSQGSTMQFGVSAGTEKTYGSTSTPPFVWTNIYIFMYVFDGTSSALWTNNVVVGTGNEGANNMSGITLSSRYSLPTSRGVAYAFPEMIVCNGTNTAANRMLMYQYFTNKYQVGM